jgi:glutamyl-tRNA synthetase
MSSPAIRVRFAPSPTGYLHIGGGRTALFNWLYVRKYGGTFILRIEDTDKERSTDENTRSILEGLKWLGLDWDEGPFLQSDGVERHQRIAHELVASGQAYRSFATVKDLEAQRKQADNEKRPWLRDAPSRGVSKEESDARAAKGEPFTVRFRVPEGDGATVFEDGVYGTQERKHQDTEDFALLRPDGSPLYNFVVVCDDIHMVISHVIRGQDHLSNTHKQILLYQALGRKPPVFAHLPLINAPDRSKLSKRKHGEVVSVTTYRDKGFIPEAFRNFLALIGWSSGTDKEFFTTAELVEAFSLSGVSRGNAIVNFSEKDPRQWTDRKALHLNAEHMNKMPLQDLLPMVEAELKAAGLWDESWSSGWNRREWFARTVDLLRPRFITLKDFSGLGRAFFDQSYDIDPGAVEKNVDKEPALRGWLVELASRFKMILDFKKDTAEAELRKFADDLGIKAGLLINGSRTVTTGVSVGPPLFDLLECLGQDTVVARLAGAETFGRTR